MKHPRRGAALLLLLFLLGAWAIPSLATQPQTDMIKAFGEKPLSLTPFKGKAILAFFFVAGHSGCRTQLAAMRKIYDTYDPNQLHIILSHEWALEETEANTRKVVEELGLQGMSFFEDEGLKLAKKLKLTSVPTTLIIDANGLLVDGFQDSLHYDTLAMLVDRLGVPKQPGVEDPVQIAPTETPDITPEPTQPEPTLPQPTQRPTLEVTASATPTQEQATETTEAEATSAQEKPTPQQTQTTEPLAFAIVATPKATTEMITPPPSVVVITPPASDTDATPQPTDAAAATTVVNTGNQIDMVAAFGSAPLSLEKLRGKAIAVFFFIEGDKECRRQLSQWKKLYDSYDPEGLHIILSHEWTRKETQKNTQKVVKDLGLQEMAFFEDEGLKLAQKLKVPSVPTAFFIDPQGMLAEAYGRGLSFETMAEIVERMGVAKRNTGAQPPQGQEGTNAPAQSTQTVEGNGPPRGALGVVTE